jgi:hypothetical protein
MEILLVLLYRYAIWHIAHACSEAEETAPAPVKGGPGELLWLPFEISVPRCRPPPVVPPPREVTAPLRVAALAPHQNGRALLTIHDVRLAASGINICCTDSQLDPTMLYSVLRTRTDNLTTFMQARLVVPVSYGGH